MPRDADGLTPKQARFAEIAVRNPEWEAGEIAIAAGFTSRRAPVTGCELFKNPDVLRVIERKRAALEVKAEVTQAQVVQELAWVAFGDQRAVMEWGPDGVTLRDSSELTDDEAALVAEVAETKTKDGGSIRLKTNSKLGALELLGKHLGMFTDRVRHEGPGGGPIQYVEVERLPKRERASSDPVVVPLVTRTREP